MRNGHIPHMASSKDAPVPVGTGGNADSETSVPTEDPELADLMEEAIGYHEKALSENTRKAYRHGWEDFAEFCEEHGLEAYPASEQAVALFLTDRARSLSTSTLKQRLAAIQHVHDQREEESPTRSKAVRGVMRGIRRDKTRRPHRPSRSLRRASSRWWTLCPCRMCPWKENPRRWQGFGPCATRRAHPRRVRRRLPTLGARRAPDGGPAGPPRRACRDYSREQD